MIPNFVGNYHLPEQLLEWRDQGHLTRIRFLAKARDLFWLHGYAGTSISDLEAATGLARTSLYQAFGDKQQLFKRVLGHYQRDNFDYLQLITASAKTWVAALRQLFADAVVRLSAESPCRGCLIANTTTGIGRRQ